MIPYLRRASVCLLVCSICLIPAAWVQAGSHRWVITEAFTNADGSVQFIELFSDSSNEVNMANKSVTSSALGTMYTFPANLPTGSTLNKHYLLATPSFSKLACVPGTGAAPPTPDGILAPNSFSFNGDTLQWHIYSTSILSFTGGQIPVDGISSWNRPGVQAQNTPTNFSGDNCTVNAAAAVTPSAVPSGGDTGTPMSAARLDAAGSQIRVSFDTSTCGDNADHTLVYGEGSQLPGAAGGAFAVGGAVCNLGSSSPFSWSNVPLASDGSGLIWWLVVGQDSADTEGSWGQDGAGAERVGPGNGGSSGQCGAGDKDTSNTCGL